MTQQGIKQEQGYDPATWSLEHGYLAWSSVPQLDPSVQAAAAPGAGGSTSAAAGGNRLHNLEGLTAPTLPQELAGLLPPHGVAEAQSGSLHLGSMTNASEQPQLYTSSSGAASVCRADDPAREGNMLAATATNTVAAAAAPTEAMHPQHPGIGVAAAAGQPAAALSDSLLHPANTAAGAADAATAAMHTTSTCQAAAPPALQQSVTHPCAPMLTVSIPDPSAVGTNESAYTYMVFSPGSVTWPASYPIAAALTQQGPMGPGAAAVAAATAAGWNWQHPDAAAAYAAAVNEAVVNLPDPSEVPGDNVSIDTPHSFERDIFTMAAEAAAEGAAAAGGVAPAAGGAAGWATTALPASVSALPTPSSAASEHVGVPDSGQMVGDGKLAQPDLGATAAGDEHMLQPDASELPGSGVFCAVADVQADADDNDHVQQKHKQKKQRKASGRGGSRRYLASLFEQWAAAQPDLPTQTFTTIAAAAPAAGDTVPTTTGNCSSSVDPATAAATVAAAAAATARCMQEVSVPQPPAFTATYAAGDAAPGLDNSRWQQQQVQQQQALQDFEAAAPSRLDQAAAKAEQYGLSELMWLMEAETAAERAAAVAPPSSAAAEGGIPSAQDTMAHHADQQQMQQQPQQLLQQTPTTTPTAPGSQHHAGAGIRRLMSPGLYSFAAASPVNSPTSSAAAAAGMLVSSPSPVQSRAAGDAAHVTPQRAASGLAGIGAQQQLVDPGISAAIPPAGGFLSDQFAAPESAVAGLVQLQEAVGDQPMSGLASAAGGLQKPTRGSRGKNGGVGTARTPKRCHVFTSAAAPDNAAAAVSTGTGSSLSSLECAEAGLRGSPMQPLFRGNSRSMLTSPSALYQFDGTATFFSPSGGALGLMHMHSTSPGQLYARSLGNGSSSTPSHAADAGGAADVAGSASLLTPQGRVSSRSAASRRDGGASLQSPDSLFKTPKVPPLRSYAGGAVPHETGPVASHAGFSSQSGFGTLTRDNSMVAVMNLASPAGWAMTPAAAQGPLPNKLPFRGASARGPGKAGAPATTVDDADQGLSAALGVLLGGGTARLGGAVGGSPGLSSQLMSRTASMMTPGSDRQQRQQTPDMQSPGDGSAGTSAGPDAGLMLMSPGMLIPHNPLSFYPGFMSPTTYTWRQPVQNTGGGDCQAQAAAAGAADPITGTVEPTSDMLSRLLAPPLQRQPQVTEAAPAVDAEVQAPIEAAAVAAPAAGDAAVTLAGIHQGGAMPSVAAAAAPDAAAASREAGSVTSGAELVSGAELLLSLAVAAVDAEAGGGDAAGRGTAAPATWTVSAAAEAEAAGVQDAATTLVMLSPRKRARKPKVVSPSAPTAAALATAPAADPQAADVAAPLRAAGAPDGTPGDAAAADAVADPSGDVHGRLPAAEAVRGDAAEQLSAQPADVVISPGPHSIAGAYTGSTVAGPAADRCQHASRKRAAGSSSRRSSNCSSRTKKRGGGAAHPPAEASYWVSPQRQDALTQATEWCAEGEPSMLAPEDDAGLATGPADAAQHVQSEPEKNCQPHDAGDGIAERVRAMLAQPPSPSHLTRPSSHAHIAAAAPAVPAAIAQDPQVLAQADEATATPASAAHAAEGTMATCAPKSITAAGSESPAGDAAVQDSSLNPPEPPQAQGLLLQEVPVETPLLVATQDNPSTREQVPSADAATEVGNVQAVVEPSINSQGHSRATEEADVSGQQHRDEGTAVHEPGVGGDAKQWGAAGPAEVLAAMQVMDKPFELPASVMTSSNTLKALSLAVQQQQKEEQPEQPKAAEVVPPGDGPAAAVTAAADSDPELFTPANKPKTRSRRRAPAAVNTPAGPPARSRSTEAPALDLLSAAAEVASATARQAVTSAFPAKPVVLSVALECAIPTAALLSPPAAALPPVFTPAAQAHAPAVRTRSTRRRPPTLGKTPSEIAELADTHRTGMSSHTPQSFTVDSTAHHAAGIGDSQPVAMEQQPAADARHTAVDHATLKAPQATTAGANASPQPSSPASGSALILQSYYIDPSSPHHLRLRPRRAAAKDADARRKQQQEQQAVPLQALSKAAGGGVRVKQEPEQQQLQRPLGQQDHSKKRKRSSSALADLAAAAAADSGADDALCVVTPSKHAAAPSKPRKRDVSGSAQQQGCRDKCERASAATVTASTSKKNSRKTRKDTGTTGLALLAAAGEEAAAGDDDAQLDQQQQPAVPAADPGADSDEGDQGSGSDQGEDDDSDDEASDSSAEVSGASGTSSDSWEGGSSSGDDDSDNDSDFGENGCGKRRAGSVSAAAAATSKRVRQPPRRGASSSARRTPPTAAAVAAGGSQCRSGAGVGSSSGTASAAAAAPSRAPNPKGGRPLGAGNKGQMVPRFTDQAGQLKFGCRSTVFTGVYRCKRNTVRWRTQFSYGGKVLNVGSFPTELDAARAWNAAAIHFRGRDTWLNPVEPQLPEDGGVAVAEKLPQPPWGSLLLSTLDEVAQQHEREGTQQAAADGQQEQ